MDSSAIILGFTGSIGSGCSSISSTLSKIAPTFAYFKLSDAIRRCLLEEDSISKPSVDQLQNKGNELRRKHGKHFLAHSLIEELKSKEHNEIIIDGIKNVEEVNYLRYFPFFFLFSVHADRELRSKRCCSGSGKIFDSEEEFLKADKRDELELDEYGQQVRECNYISDIIVLNNDHVPQYPETKMEAFARQIYNRYVIDIQNLRSGSRSPDTKPTIHEFAMTTAYAASKMSSCEKRKVGAVIADIQRPTSSISNEGEQRVGEIPNIISIGYNEVPLGAYKCVYEPQIQKCYRDHQQELYAKKMQYCPGCGKEIHFNSVCPACGKKYDAFLKICPECHREVDVEAECGCDIYREYIPGGKDTPGKLLDLCRALHAEEKALMNLLKSGRISSDSLVMFTTTQPCNLCANKIVTAGIKKVVFAEPYFMPESYRILEDGGVETERFEGVKSSAYFRLYQ